MRKAKFFPMYLLLLVSLVSCSVREEVPFETGMGGIRLELLTDLTATRADAEGQLSPEDFKIEIINPQGVIFKRWDTYAEYLAQESTVFAMNAGGPYTLRASYGDSAASGFNAFFFIGEQEFTVQPQQVTDVSVTCRMGNVKVAVEFGDNIRKQYTEYTATVSTLRGSLVFDKDCKEAGYLPCGDISVYVELTGPDGETSGFTNSKEIVGEPGDFITLKIDTGGKPDQGVSLTVSIDPATDDHQVDIELPSDMLPDNAGADVAAIPDGDVWATRVYVDMTTDGDPAELYPEIRAYGTSEWSRPSFTSSVSGNVNRVTVTGLAPSTKYEVRARYKSAVSPVLEFTTEAAQQVGNAGFEDWTEDVFDFKLGWSIFSRNKSIEWYRPWADGERWWDVNSKYTMPGDYSWIDLNQNTGNFPSVAYTVNDVRSGSRSAMLYTTWVGYSVDKVDRLSNGELFIGTANDDGTHASEGHEFGSRPSQLRFAYKYDAMEGESFYVRIEMKDASGNTIGSGELSDGPASGTWQVCEVPVSYVRTDVKASSIYIIFKSTSTSTPSYTEKSMNIGNNKTYSSGCNIGSILYLDDVELIYE